MLRALAYLIGLGLAAWIAATFAEHPGSVTLHWQGWRLGQGWRLDTSAAVALVAVFLVAAVAALAYRLWRFLKRAPARLGQARREGRQRRGYLALTRGMVAVAAGDATEADRQVKRAEVLLDEPPLTMLLSAQAAQLVGDEDAAGRFFEAMAERPETEFLGIRGLLTQAMKRGDAEETRRLAEAAHALKPDSEWVATSLFAEQVGAGRWAEAEATLKSALKEKLVEPDAARRRRAVLVHQQGMEAGDAGAGLDLARRAHELEPGFVPAAVRLAEGLGGAGKERKALAVIARAWQLEPHPDLVSALRTAHGADDGLDFMRAVQRLVEGNPDHLESRLAVGAAALEAELWGEARKSLEGIAAHAGASARVCRLMARLEECEHGDAPAARDWLVRAADAAPDPAWVCADCGTVATHWAACCGRCGAFDGLVWQTPPRILEGEADRPQALAAT